jgi:hypothetical protein
MIKKISAAVFALLVLACIRCVTTDNLEDAQAEPQKQLVAISSSSIEGNLGSYEYREGSLYLLISFRANGIQVIHRLGKSTDMTSFVFEGENKFVLAEIDEHNQQLNAHNRIDDKGRPVIKGRVVKKVTAYIPRDKGSFQAIEFYFQDGCEFEQ